MKRKNSSSEPTFTEREIELMKDVTQPHKALAKRFGKSTTLIQAYRRYNLGIYLRGLNYNLESIRETTDWRMTDLTIAGRMKVSPETVSQWRRKLFDKPNKRVKLSDQQKLDIASSSEKSSRLAVRYGVTVWTINRVRRKSKTNIGTGRPRFTFRDFPADTNWRRPSRQIAKNLGISWLTADRLRTEALVQASYLPTMQIQMELPGIIEDRTLQSVLDGVDWTENTSLLSTHLKLDKHEVSKFKLTARRQRRRT